jgi:hypothetical protein
MTLTATGIRCLGPLERCWNVAYKVSHDLQHRFQDPKSWNHVGTIVPTGGEFQHGLNPAATVPGCIESFDFRSSTTANGTTGICLDQICGSKSSASVEVSQ